MKAKIALLATFIGLLMAAAPGLAQSQGALPASCSLLSAAEIGQATGLSIAPLQQTGAFCMSRNANATVMLRIARRTNAQGGVEERGIQAAREMGVTVDVRQDGPVTCSSASPPASLARVGYNTTCAVMKNGAVAAVEVTTPTQQTMVPIARLRPLADVMARRF